MDAAEKRIAERRWQGKSTINDCRFPENKWLCLLQNERCCSWSDCMKSMMLSRKSHISMPRETRRQVQPPAWTWRRTSSVFGDPQGLILTSFPKDYIQFDSFLTRIFCLTPRLTSRKTRAVSRVCNNAWAHNGSWCFESVLEFAIQLDFDRTIFMVEAEIYKDVSAHGSPFITSEDVRQHQSVFPLTLALLANMWCLKCVSRRTCRGWRCTVVNWCFHLLMIIEQLTLQQLTSLNNRWKVWPAGFIQYWRSRWWRLSVK